MPSELDQMNPDMGASPEQNTEVVGLHNGEQDREGAMAKADLYKLANYSHKLFQQIQDEDQLEGWVQAKITKAADYIASVYHYLEYEMKFSEYGHHLDNSDTLSEGQKMRLKEMLAEAKDKMKDLKKSQAEKMKEKKVDEGVLSGGHRMCDECGGTGMVYEEPKPVPAHVQSKVEKYKKLVKATHAAHKRMDANHDGIPDEEEVDEGFDEKSKTGDTFKTRTGIATKTSTGVTHKKTDYSDEGDSEEKSGKGIKSHAKAKSADEKKAERGADIKLPKHPGGTYGMKNGEKFDNRKIKEGAKPDFLDLDKDGDKKETMKKAAMQKKKTMKEGMSHADMAHYHATKCAECYQAGMLETAMHHKDECEKHGGTMHIAQGKCHHSHPHINGGQMYECGSGMMYEAEQKTMSRAAKGMMKYGKDGMKALAKAGREGKDLDKVRDKYDKYDESIETDHKKPCPPMSHVKKMCQDGKSVSEICKMHPDCDHTELRKMVADCKKHMAESTKPSAGLSKGEKSAVVKKAKAGGDIGKPGKGFAKLAKKAGGGEKGEKIAAAAMWKNMKETTAYMMEKAKATKNLPGNQEKIDTDHDGKIEKSDLAALRAGKKEKETVKESTELNRMKELMQRLNG